MTEDLNTIKQRHFNHHAKFMAICEAQDMHRQWQAGDMILLPKPRIAFLEDHLSGTVKCITQEEYEEIRSTELKRLQQEFPKTVLTYTTEKGQTIWMTPEFKKGLDEMQAELDRHTYNFLFHGIPFPKREPKEDDNVKLAFVYQGSNRVMVGLDTKTMIAYQLRDDCPMWKLPLESIEYASFDRWCTSFDT